MKSSTIVSLLALVVSAVALATVLVRSSGPPARETGSDRSPALAPDPSLLERLEALSAENESLRDRVAVLEVLPDPAGRAPVTGEYASKEEFEAFRDEVRDALGRREPMTGEVGALPEFKEQVATTLSEIRREETVQKVRAQQAARLERLDETMPKIEEWLDLTPHQASAMRTALLAQYEREAELVRRWEAGEDPEVLGELKAADREAHRLDLAVFLMPEQLETYWNRGSGGGK